LQLLLWPRQPHLLLLPSLLQLLLWPHQIHLLLSSAAIAAASVAKSTSFAAIFHCSCRCFCDCIYLICCYLWLLLQMFLWPHLAHLLQSFDAITVAYVDISLSDSVADVVMSSM
jgi:hypothetical protein